MLGEVWQLAGALVAILGIILLVHCLGFSRPAQSLSAQEAAEYFRLAPAGFSAESMVLDKAGAAAIAVSAEGRVMLLRRHGAAFLCRPLDSEMRIERIGDQLKIDCEGRQTIVQLDGETIAWERLIREALRR